MAKIKKTSEKKKAELETARHQTIIRKQRNQSLWTKRTCEVCGKTIKDRGSDFNFQRHLRTHKLLNR